MKVADTGIPSTFWLLNFASPFESVFVGVLGLVIVAVVPVDHDVGSDVIFLNGLVEI